MLYNNISQCISTIYNNSGIMISEAYSNLGIKLDLNSNTSENTTLKIMTFNIGEITGINQESTLKHIIDKYNVDCIGIQEAYKTSKPTSFNNIFSDYPYVHFGNQVNKDALVSKIYLENTTSTIFDYNTLETRAYSKTYITFNNIKICWINTHLETTSGGEAKVKQAQELFNIAKDEPYFIITGDFNTICKSTDHTEYIKIIKPFLDIEAKSVNCTEEGGFINTWTDSTIINQDNGYPTDHIIVSKTIDIKNVIFDYYKNELNYNKTIDHIPIIAELIIK